METGPQTDLSGVVVAGPTGPGWVVELKGYHYYNDTKADRRDTGTGHLRKTLLEQLKTGIVNVPGGPGQPPERFTMKELGIGFAILPTTPKPRDFDIPNPNYAGPAPGTVGGEGAAMPGLGGGAGMPGASGLPGAAPIDPNNPPYFRVRCYEFAVQFVWQEKPLNVRKEEREKKIAEAKLAAEAAAAAAASATPAEGAAPGAPPPPAPQVGVPAAPGEQVGPAPTDVVPAGPVAPSNDGGAGVPGGTVPGNPAEGTGLGGPGPAPPAVPVAPVPPAIPEAP
jgi:type IV pilus assembly protein PilM